jgi:hypothetical protein
VTARDANVDPATDKLARQDASYPGGVIATLRWVLGELPDTPITGIRSSPLTANLTITWLLGNSITPPLDPVKESL